MEQFSYEHLNELNAAFRGASRLPLREAELMTESDRYGWEQERAADGAKVFKRRVLGLCGRSTIKTKEELSSILCEIEAAEDIEGAKHLVDLLVKVTKETGIGGVTYCYDLFAHYKKLMVEPISNLRNNQQYKISVG